MASSGLRRGIDLHTYRNTGTYAVPTWTEVTNVRDQNLNNKRTKIDANYRGGAPYTAKVAGLIDLNPTWEMIYDYSDIHLQAIFNAYYANLPASNQVEFAWADGNISGTNVRYIRAICSIFDVSEKQDLDGIDLVSIDVAPTYNTNGVPQVVSA